MQQIVNGTYTMQESHQIEPWMFIVPICITIASILFMIYARKQADPDMLELNKEKFTNEQIYGIDLINYKRKKAGLKEADRDLWFLTYYRIIYVKRSQHKITSFLSSVVDKIPEPYLSQILEEKKNGILMQKYQESIDRCNKQNDKQQKDKKQNKQHKKQD